jgi:hypothetical protein
MEPVALPSVPHPPALLYNRHRTDMSTDKALEAVQLHRRVYYLIPSKLFLIWVSCRDHYRWVG